MIEHIVRIPERLPVGTILTSEKQIRTFSGNITTSGRSIKIAPLIFYKVISSWANTRYEHIFVTDDPLECGLYKNRMSTKRHSILFPVSVKRIAPTFVSTHLFSKSIDIVLRYYTGQSLLAEISPLLPPVDTPCLVQSTPFTGVTNYIEFQGNMFNTEVYSMGYNSMVDASTLMRISTLTLEDPILISTSITEMLNNRNPNNTSSMHSTYMYEHGKHFDMLEYINDYIYSEWPADPVTLKCVLSPYITYGDLVPYIGTGLGYNEMLRHTDPQVPITPLQFYDDIDYIKLMSLMTEFINIPTSDFQIEVTPDDIFANYQYTYTQPHQHWCTTIDRICQSLYLAPGVLQRYDKIILCKNWLDEISITYYINGQQPFTKYIHLGWFHLISPSLINKTYQLFI